MYDIVFDEKAIEFLEKMEKNMRRRIYNKIISTKENPFHYFERLSGRNLLHYICLCIPGV